jgi:hypothetical protein
MAKRKTQLREQPGEPLAPHTEEGRKAYQSVLEHGFPRFPHPDHNAGTLTFRVLPPNVTELDSPSLGEHLSYWSAMHSYAVEQGVLVGNDLETHKKKMDREVSARLSRDEDKLTVTDRKARARQHPNVIVLQERTDHLQLVHNLIEGIKSNCERNYATLSREISRRNNHAD